MAGLSVGLAGSFPGGDATPAAEKQFAAMPRRAFPRIPGRLDDRQFLTADDATAARAVEALARATHTAPARIIRAGAAMEMPPS